MADEEESGSSSDDELAEDEGDETPRLSVQDGDSEDESDYRNNHAEIGGLEGSAVGKSRREDDEATLLSQSPRSEGRGRSRSPKRGKKKGGKSPKSGKSRSKSKSKSKSRSKSKSKSKKGRSKSKSPKSKKGTKSKSPKGSRSRSKSPKGKGKGKKGKGKKGGKKGKKRKSFQQMGRKEIQAALDRTVYEARIQELERQLARVKHQRDKVLKLTDEDSEVKDFMSKEMQVELEHQQTVIQDLITKAAEERRSRRRQERLLQDQITQQGGALKRAEAQVTSLQRQVSDSQAMWEDAQKALLDHDNLLKQIKALKDQLNDKDTTLKEYEGRLTILQRAAKMAGLIQKTKTGEMKAVGGATGLVPILLEGMKMFPLDRVLQREMCVLITHIAFTPEDYLIMSQYEGLELILKALENHRASRPLVASALRMLWKFSTASLELRDRLRSYGGIALMLNLLTVIPQQSVRRMEFFAGRTIAYLMPPRISKHCPPELLAEEIAKSRETHQRRVSEGNLPFLITPTISVMNNAPRRKSTSIDGVVGAPLQEGRVEAALPGAFGETSTLLLSTWDLVKILLTFLTWASSELVEFDPEAARCLRERREAEEKALNPIPPVSARSSNGSTAPASSHGSVSRGEGWSKAKQNMRRVSNNEVEAEAGLWRPNPVLARKMAGDALVALVAAIEARDDGSACRRLVFSQASLTIVTRVWRVFFDSPDVVMAACVLIRNSLLVEAKHRAEQLTFLRTAGLDRLLKASQRRLAGDSKVMTEIITLSRIFFVEVVF